MEFSIWNEQFHCVLGEAVAEGLSSKGCSGWGCIWLLPGHQWRASGSTLGPGLLNIFINDLDTGLNAPLAGVLMIPNWELLLTVLRNRTQWQRDLDRLGLWTRTDGRKFNMSKC